MLDVAPLAKASLSVKTDKLFLSLGFSRLCSEWLSLVRKAFGGDVRAKMQRRRSRAILLIILEKVGQGYSATRDSQSLMSLGGEASKADSEAEISLIKYLR
jgi:hypothetical protein